MYLGLDLGTSELKALLLADDHRIVASAGAPLGVRRPRPRWSEQDPADWWAALERVMATLAATHPAELAAVRAIGPTGQMHGAVLLDAAGGVLRPAILWNDGRSAAQCRTLESRVPRLHAIAGNLAMPGFTAPKLLWLAEHEPDVFARVAKVLLPKDWLRWRLTGEHASDRSDASGTLWLDVGARRWSDELLAACGMSVAQMPRLVEGSDVAGRLRGDVAARFGLRAGIAVAGGAGDNAASAVGIGAVRAGQGFVSLGTSGVVFVAGDAFRPNPAAAVHAFCHALPGRWHQMSVMLSAASALRWAAGLLGLGSEAELIARAASLDVARRDAAPLFLPYLGGERTPHNDADAKAVFFGLGHEHAPDDAAYAALEGVTLGLLDGWRALGAAPGEVRSLALVGGGARSAEWSQMLASALGVPLTLGDGGEAGGALGAARLAWLADGGRLDEVARAGPPRRLFEPDPDEGVRLAARGRRVSAVYQALAAAGAFAQASTAT